MSFDSELEGVHTLAIYLGNTCNFDCSYCDRSYIENQIGGQNIGHSQVARLKNFFTQVFSGDHKFRQIAFHGGEPFLFVKRMDQIAEELRPFIEQYDLKIRITTNTSLMLQEEWFVRKWAKHLALTFSYDFIFQKENRDETPIVPIIDLCNECDIPIQWQFVMPVLDKRCFSLELVQDIVHIVSRCKVDRSINLIPLRHHRGEEKFEVFIDQLNIPQFFDAFTRFINTLYNYKLQVYVDGNYGVVDKNYLGNHYKMILSPDGFIYPEYDFCEYKSAEYRIGQWSDGLSSNFIPRFFKPHSEDDLGLNTKCVTCPSRSSCGLKHLYKLFKREPGEKCVLYYQVIDALVAYCTTIRQHKGFYHWIAHANR